MTTVFIASLPALRFPPDLRAANAEITYKLALNRGTVNDTAKMPTTGRNNVGVDVQKRKGGPLATCIRGYSVT